MEKEKWGETLWRTVVIPAVVIMLFFFAASYLIEVFKNEGTEKFVYSLVLISSLIVGLAQIILFAFRKALEKENSPKVKRQKRRLEKYRNVVNYITPFVLVIVGSHFWQKEFVLATIIVSILLLDRLNELLRKNK